MKGRGDGSRTRDPSAARRRGGIREPRRGLRRSASRDRAPDPARRRTLPRTRRSRRCSRSGENLPELRDPARFEAWSCSAPCQCLSRRGSPNAASGNRTLRVLHDDEHPAARTTWRHGPSIGTSSSADFRRLSIDHRAVVVLHHVPGPDAARRSPTPSASPPARSAPDSTTRCARCARRSTLMNGRRFGRPRNDHRTRDPADHRVVDRGRPNAASGPCPRRRARPAPRDPPASTLVGRRGGSPT